ncbi:head decoration protein [Alsobacter sp. R-9]
MAALTEGTHRAAFIVSDLGFYSYEVGTLASGQDVAAGQALMLSGGNLVAWSGATDSNCIGFALDAVDASSGAKEITYLARGAEVREDDLTFPAGTRTLLLADLALLNPAIVLR